MYLTCGSLKCQPALHSLPGGDWFNRNVVWSWDSKHAPSTDYVKLIFVQYFDSVILWCLQVQQTVWNAGYLSDVDLDHGPTLNKKIRNAQLAQYNFIFGKKACVILHKTASCVWLPKCCLCSPSVPMIFNTSSCCVHVIKFCQFINELNEWINFILRKWHLRL